jgi:hypothetical protein
MSSVADWVKEQAPHFFSACQYEACANIVMDVLRGAEVWARRNRRDPSTVQIEHVYWSHDRLVVTFK